MNTVVLISGDTNPADVCMLPYKTGPCRASQGRFYYNHKLGHCTAFIYGGCRGNGNNFKTADLCKRGCMKQRQSTLMSGVNEGVPQGDRICALPKVTGPCKAMMGRFYFDVKSNDCIAFIYGGCHGNQNNFQSVNECVNRFVSH